MRIKEAIKVAKLYLKFADNFYKVQEQLGVKFPKGRLKFRRDIKEALQTLIKCAQSKRLREDK